MVVSRGSLGHPRHTGGGRYGLSLSHAVRSGWRPMWRLVTTAASLAMIFLPLSVFAFYYVVYSSACLFLSLRIGVLCLEMWPEL